MSIPVGAASARTPRGTRPLLVTGLVAALLLGGCTPAPVISSDSRPSASASVIDPGGRRIAQSVIDAQGLLVVALAEPDRWQFSTAQLTWLTSLAELHEAQLTVLLQADPLGGVNTDRRPTADLSAAAPTLPGDPAAFWTTLAATESAISAQAREAAGRQGPGAMGLLWASVATVTADAGAASTRPDALGPVFVAGAVVPSAVDLEDLNEARQVLLSQLHLLIYLLRVGLGRLDDSDPMITRVEARLGLAQQERDELIDLLTEQGITPEPAALSYELPGEISPASALQTTWGGVEADIQTAWGEVTAASTAGPRDQAIDELVLQSARMRELGVASGRWPGWA